VKFCLYVDSKQKNWKTGIVEMIIETVISAIVALAVEDGWNSINQAEKVTRILKKAGFKSETPTPDFDTVYVYALIKYGINKPKPLLEIFRNENIRIAFREFFEHQNVSMLEEELAGVSDWHFAGDELRRMEIDPLQEINTFTQIFHDLVDSARTTVQVKQDQKLQDIRTDLQEISQRLPKGESASIAYPTRLEQLQLMQRTSRARCIASWLALGLSSDEAIKFADDLSVGVPHRDFQTTPTRKVVILTAEFGTGKSLIAERLLQKAISKAISDISAPIPVYLDARFSDDLQTAVKKYCEGIGNLRHQGATIIVDGTDEMGFGRVKELMNESRILVNVWDNTTVTITSRPIPSEIPLPEIVNIPKLSPEQAIVLISQIAKREIMDWEWPETFKDAVQRPLFALLAGIYLRENKEIPTSTGELIANIVNRALNQIDFRYRDFSKLFQKLAVSSTFRGGSLVPAVEIASSHEVEVLLNSRLVIQNSGNIGFPLPILTQWFAAQSLAEGETRVDVLLNDNQQLEYWRYPLVIAVAYFSHDQVSSILKPLVRRHPAFTSQIVQESLSSSNFDLNFSLPHKAECERRIRQAMNAWISGLDFSLAQMIAPVNFDGELLPLALGVDGPQLNTAWQYDELTIPLETKGKSTVRMSTTGQISRFRRNKTVFKGGLPSSQSAWAWQWTLEELTSNLSRVVESRAFVVKESPLAHEWLWQLILAISESDLYIDAIPLIELEARIVAMEKWLEVAPVEIHTYMGKYLFDKPTIDLLNTEIKYLRENGEVEYKSPWLGPDLSFEEAKFVWDVYSSERLLERIKLIYKSAMDSYPSLINTWFSKMSNRMQIAVTLPARLKGNFSPPSDNLPPALTWYLEPLPQDSQNIVDIQINKDNSKYDVEKFRILRDRLRSLRPSASHWISFTWHSQSLTDIFEVNPIAKLTFDWLQDDLRRVSWIE
jgi:hypothetical protein